MNLIARLDALRAKVKLPWHMATSCTGSGSNDSNGASFFTECGPHVTLLDRTVALKSEDAEFLCAVANAYDLLREVVEAAREVIDSGDLRWKVLLPEILQRENRLVAALNNVKEAK